MVPRGRRVAAHGGAPAITAEPVASDAIEPDLTPTATLEPETRGGLRDILAEPAFRRLWLAQVVAQLGEAVALVALPLLAFAMTDSAVLLSFIYVLQLIPRIILAPITGVVADRVDRKRLMIACDLSRAALVALMPFTQQAWQVGVLAVLIAIGNAFARPAELAAVPMVAPPALLVPALSATQVAGSVVRVIGPALAAGIVTLSGPGIAFAAQAVCFVLSALILLGLTLPAMDQPETGPGAAGALAAVRAEMRDGLRIVWQNPIVRGTAAVEALWQLVFSSLFVVALVYVEQSLHLGDASAATFSLLTACFAGGTAVGALVARPVERRIGRPALMAVGYLAPLTLIPAAFTPPLPVLYACWLVLGFTDAWAVIAMQSYLAESVEDSLRGRMYATWTACVTLGGAAALLIVGQLAARIGPPLTLALVGATVGIGGPLLLWATGALPAMLRQRRAAVTVVE
ncbi:MAG: MFS transporter [Thermomicrobiales bacterium]